MHWLQSIDTALFHFINGTLGNPVFDWLMPRLSGGDGVMHWFSFAAVAAFIVTMICGGARARICALLLLIVVAAGDPLVIGTIKNAVGRPRPCLALPDVVERLGCSNSGSMPSAHAANWFAAAMMMFLFYRRSAWILFPLAASVAFSRVYCGVHYPGDVAAGAILGAGYAIALVILAQATWNFLGRKFFPAWHEQMPSLLHPESGIQNPESSQSAIRNPKSAIEWLRLGHLVIVLALVARWIYIASGVIGLSEDEAYQWLWSKHLALSYYSKPPGIAYIQWLGTSLFGDNNFGVRFFSPVCAAILSWLILNFMAREIGGRKAFIFLLLTFTTPLLVAGSILMTIDPPLVLCWMWAVIAGWRALQPDGKTRDWFIVGLTAGLGFFCKYSAIFLPVCFAIYFALQPSARVHLRKPGPWLALGVLALCTLPVVIWNYQHGWATIHHVAGNAGLNSPWHPTLKYFFEFLVAQIGLLNPIFFLGMMWACFAFWKKRKEKPLQLFLFCLGAPVFFGYWLYTFHSRVLPNWIAPAIPPLFCLMALFWVERRVNLKPWLAASMVIGLSMSAIMYDSDLLGKIIAKLPGDKDPSHRVRGWSETARLVEAEREKFSTNAFIIADHYGTAGLYSFYSPPARAAAISGTPLAYCTDDPEDTNQFFFWDEYNYRAHRHGQNAIFIRRLDPYPLESGWVWKWLKQEPVQPGEVPSLPRAPWNINREFETVTNLGIREIKLKDGRVFQRVQIFGCYNLNKMSAMEISLPVRDYDLAATLDSGQVFRWQKIENSWHGVIGKNSVRLTQTETGIHAKTAAPVADWNFLREFLQTGIDFTAVLKTFPDDEPMNRAVASCRGLRLLRQEPWECLASFILSSTKQIVQIRQIVSLLCERFGEPVAIAPFMGSTGLRPVVSGVAPETVGRCGQTLIRADDQQRSVSDEIRRDAGFDGRDARATDWKTFPTPQRIAALTEQELRACKMGFRAPNLLAAARQIAGGKFDMEKIRSLDYAEARAELMKLRGVGGKIADCVLLFAYGSDSAFPVDVWIERALQRLYFPRRRASGPRLRRFAATHFGPHAGYAQQYLFHYMRTKVK